MGFAVFKFHPRITQGIQALGFTKPTPIQEKGIPVVLSGRDLLGLAQTGTGKTAAFVLPILERLVAGSPKTLRTLILAPTRELAEQIHEVIRELTPHTGIRSMTVYGGVGMGKQVEKLRSGIDIVVACPGRLLDHVEHKTINLSQIEVLVIDEADRMFDMGFLPDIRRVIGKLPKKRQTLFFSATMPDEILKLVSDVLSDPITVKIGHSAPASTVEHALYPVPQHLKTDLLLDILKKTKTGSVLVFTRTKHRAKKVAQVLAREGYTSAELQGNLSQNRRQASLDGFRTGRYRVLVATDIAARGIDVEAISHVINYDIPDTTDAYTHRIGRTGRMANTGDAFTFVTSEDEDTVRAIERVLKTPIERRKVEGFDYQKSAPKKNTEFARAPRPSRQPIVDGKPSRSASRDMRAPRREDHPIRDHARREDHPVRDHVRREDHPVRDHARREDHPVRDHARREDHPVREPARREDHPVRDHARREGHPVRDHARREDRTSHREAWTGSRGPAKPTTSHHDGHAATRVPVDRAFGSMGTPAATPSGRTGKPAGTSWKPFGQSRRYHK